MIVIAQEQLLRLDEAAKLVPGLRKASVHVETIRRWAKTGLRGVLLETCFLGGQEFTSQEALQRFSDALSQKRRAKGQATNRRRIIRDIRQRGDDPHGL